MLWLQSDHRRQRPEVAPRAFIGVASNIEPLPPLGGKSASPPWQLNVHARLRLKRGIDFIQIYTK